LLASATSTGPMPALRLQAQRLHDARAVAVGLPDGRAATAGPAVLGERRPVLHHRVGQRALLGVQRAPEQAGEQERQLLRVGGALVRPEGGDERRRRAVLELVGVGPRGARRIGEQVVRRDVLAGRQPGAGVGLQRLERPQRARDADAGYVASTASASSPNSCRTTVA
jgi:hypothetical protein